MAIVRANQNTGSDKSDAPRGFQASWFLAISLFTSLSACANERSVETWTQIEPIMMALSYEQENAAFCGWENPARADKLMTELNGALKPEAEAKLQIIRDEFNLADAEYVCTPERFTELTAQADAALETWNTLKEKQK